MSQSSPPPTSPIPASPEAETPGAGAGHARAGAAAPDAGPDRAGSAGDGRDARAGAAGAGNTAGGPDGAEARDRAAVSGRGAAAAATRIDHGGSAPGTPGRGKAGQRKAGQAKAGQGKAGQGVRAASATAGGGSRRAASRPPDGNADGPGIPVHPPVSRTGARLRHWVVLLSFILVVLAPSAISGWYLWSRAVDQYVSTIAFSVRKEEAAPSVDFLGGLTQLTGGSAASDTDILYDFLRSEDIVARLDETVDLRARFSKAWPQDPVFALDPAEPLEELTDYWQRQVRVLYDNATSLITLEVAAFTPEDALEIAQATFAESSSTINRLSDIAREDATSFARGELEQAQSRLSEARQAMTAFRTRTQIVDPAADIAGQMGVLNSLQAQLAEAMIALDTLSQNARSDDPRVIQGQQRIDAIRGRIADERSKFGAQEQGPAGESYAELMAEYERLAVDMEFAETSYRAAQVAYETALGEAQRQSRYLAAHIEPKLAETSLKPDRPVLLAAVFGVLLVIWSIMLLIYYSIRDRR
ncbi:capsule biosynthesis protein [Paracoccus sediminicola]|uniref:capsule biosynthesis protein n=1 Tax=Paracoccus sediminicola TaxID=3017783 RepID=UPI0022F02F6F|nr:capsule biosynthesis protein [Paracoccus sediminicola]WBU56128.1 capsule biosynthesis protein [Paracoccus sediminicola]